MKNKAVLAILGFVAAIAAALPATAQTKDPSGVYVGVSFGKSYNDVFCNGAGSTCRDHDQTWKVLGGYQFNRYLGVEAAYTALGALVDPATNTDNTQQAMEFVGVLSDPVYRDFAVFGKLGGYHGRTRGSVNNVSFNESNTDLTYGMGLQWNGFDPLGLRVEVQRYPRLAAGNNGTSADVSVWSFGAVFRFQ